MDELQDIEDLVVEGEEESGDGFVSKKPAGDGVTAGLVPGIGRTGLAPAPSRWTSRRRAGRRGIGRRGRRGGQVQKAVVDADAGGAVVRAELDGRRAEHARKAKRDDDLDAMEGGGRARPRAGGGWASAAARRRKNTGGAIRESR